SLAQAAAVALLLVVARGGPLWIVFAVTAVQASAAAFALPAESALLPSLVPDKDLVPANALNALNNRLGRLIGLPVGAAVYGALGLDALVLADVGSFLAAAV